MRQLRARHNAICYLYLAPTFALLAAFTVVPVAIALGGAFFEWEIGKEAHFVGLANFVEILTGDKDFWPSVLNVTKLTLFALVTRLTVPLLAAELIFALRREVSRYFFRLLFIVPMVVPGVAVILIWQLIYSDQGVISQFLRAIGRPEWIHGWLSDPKTALVSIMFIGFPFVGGFETLIYYAGLAAIPESVRDAARIDGATGLARVLKVDLPLIAGQVKLILVLAVIGSIQGFYGVMILTDGMPGTKTLVPGLMMYHSAFLFQRMGYACAIGMVLFLSILALTVVNMKLIRPAGEHEAR